jgi:hypothetical protein
LLCLAGRGSPLQRDDHRRRARSLKDEKSPARPEKSSPPGARGDQVRHTLPAFRIRPASGPRTCPQFRCLALR